TYNVWESDGTTEGSKVIFRSNQRIINLEALNEQLIIVSQNDAEVNLVNYNQEDSLTFIRSFSKSQYNTSGTFPYRSIGSDDSHLYFNLNESSGKKMIWRTDGTTSQTQMFLEGHNASSISFKEDKFDIEKIWRGNFIYLTGFSFMPEALDTLRFSSSYYSPSQTVSKKLSESIYLCGSYEYGFELGYKTMEDSLTLFGDLEKGSGSSVACLLPNFYFGCYNEENFLIEDSQDIYAILTNGNDPYFYLYHLSTSSATSYFRVSNPELLQYSFLWNDQLYWFEFAEQSWILKKYDLNQANHESQTVNSTRNKDKWLRQISAAYPGFFMPFSSNQGIRLSPRGVYLNDAGDVFVGAWVRNGQIMVNSDTLNLTPKRGTFSITKYNSYGEILWQKSMGSISNLSSFDDYFALDHEGNPVVVGSYFKKAYFDEDSLSSFRAGHYVAKLSGESGKILWKKKLSETTYANDIEKELTISFDQENNIYTSFIYKNFQLSYADTYLTSEKSPVNALASFDSRGNTRWVKNIETPWLDAFGKTRVLEYNKERNTLLAAQSQGYFNVWSSCEFRDYRYFFQEIDLNGDLVDSSSFRGSDIGALVTGAYTDDGRFIGLGYHRGTLDFGSSSTISGYSGDCHTTEGFIFEFEANSLDVLFGNTFSEPSIIPTDIKLYQDHVYIYGSRNQGLFLLKYTRDGAFVGYKDINQSLRVFDFGYFNYLDVKDGNIVLLGEKYQNDNTNQVNPLLVTEESISILKIPDEGWIQDGEGFDQLSAHIVKQESLLFAYPNPFERFIRLAATDGTTYTYYQLFKLSGSSIQEGKLSADDIYEFDFEQLNSGIYLLRLSGPDKSTAIKIMKR
ncbi:MAG: T9SS type A sorting domain-containing protein, partial [Bacteroidota bacterium]